MKLVLERLDPRCSAIPYVTSTLYPAILSSTLPHVLSLLDIDSLRYENLPWFWKRDTAALCIMLMGDWLHNERLVENEEELSMVRFILQLRSPTLRCCEDNSALNTACKSF